MSIHVIYDISVLGLGQYLRTARTGIHRFADELALGLLREDGVRVTFFAVDPLCNAFHVVGYLEENGFFEAHRSSCAFFDSRSIRLSYKWSRSWRDGVPGRKTAAFSWATLPATYALRRTGLSGRIESPVLERPGVFHAPHYVRIPSYLREKRNIRRFYTVHDLAPVKFPEYFRKSHLPYYGIRGVLRDLTGEDHVICVSESTKRDLLEYSAKVDRDKISVVYPAASRFFYPRNGDETDCVRRRYGIPEGPYILSVATLEPRKNLSHLITCFLSVIQEHKIGDLNLVLVGTKGWKYGDILQRTRHSKDVKHRIILTGFVPDEDMAPLYSGALCFAFPSLYEGFGLPILEAMKCGTPVITSNVSSLPEVVGNGGIMVDPSDDDALCQAMVSLQGDEERRRRYSAKALARAGFFSWDKSVREILNLYRQSLP